MPLIYGKAADSGFSLSDLQTNIDFPIVLTAKSTGQTRKFAIPKLRTDRRPNARRLVHYILARFKSDAWWTKTSFKHNCDVCFDTDVQDRYFRGIGSSVMTVLVVQSC